MREIKFRIWDKIQNKFIYNWQEAIAGHISYFNTDINPNNIYALQDELLVFQQFTGLKDINEVDIYEGDILEFQEDFGYHTNKGEMYYVAFEYSTFVLKYLSNNQIHGFVKDSQKDWHHSIENLGNEVKIIGNIYENK